MHGTHSSMDRVSFGSSLAFCIQVADMGNPCPEGCVHATHREDLLSLTFRDVRTACARLFHSLQELDRCFSRTVRLCDAPPPFRARHTSRRALAVTHSCHLFIDSHVRFELSGPVKCSSGVLRVCCMSMGFDSSAPVAKQNV